jgi:hypothetical protein
MMTLAELAEAAAKEPGTRPKNHVEHSSRLTRAGHGKHDEGSLQPHHDTLRRVLEQSGCLRMTSKY